MHVCVLNHFGYGLLCSTRLLCSWDSPGKNTGVGCRALLQGIFPIQEWNPTSLMPPAFARGFFTTSTTWQALTVQQVIFFLFVLLSQGPFLSFPGPVTLCVLFQPKILMVLIACHHPGPGITVDQKQHWSWGQKTMSGTVRTELTSEQADNRKSFYTVTLARKSFLFLTHPIEICWFCISLQGRSLIYPSMGFLEIYRNILKCPVLTCKLGYVNSNLLLLIMS